MSNRGEWVMVVGLLALAVWNAASGSAWWALVQGLIVGAQASVLVLDRYQERQR